MPRDPAPPLPGTSSPVRPWVLLLIGFGLSVAGWLLSRANEDVPAVYPLSLLFPGSVLTLFAVGRQLRNETWLWPLRIESAAIVSVAGLAYLAGFGAMRFGWDSGRLFYGFLFLVCLTGSILILLPSLLRRVVLSLMVLFHFTGMAVTITSIDPPGNNGPWLSKQLWAHVYRPYLSFLYLTNAYHFYSPDPGPPTLFWFAVCYDDGSYTWIKLPERANSPISMHYQRMMALPEHSFQASGMLPTARKQEWRKFGSSYDYPVGKKSLPIPFVLDMDFSWQYREPADTSRRLFGSIARRVFLEAPPARDEDGTIKQGVKVRSVKLYRIVHQLLTPAEVAAGVSPWAKHKHWPHFMGEYDEQGALVDPEDPFLFWYLPIAYVPRDYPNHGLHATVGSTLLTVPAINVRTHAPVDAVLLDCLEMHAAGRRKNIDGKQPAGEKGGQK